MMSSVFLPVLQADRHRTSSLDTVRAMGQDLNSIAIERLVSTGRLAPSTVSINAEEDSG